MSGLQYVGRTPDSDSSIINRSYADSLDETLVVTEEYVNSVISTKATPLTTPAYVDQQDLLRAHKLAVDIMDENYVPLTELGQPNGVATTDNFGSITTSQIPSTAVTNRTSLYYEAASQGVISLQPGHTQQVINTSNTREATLASITVPDPGYPWFPLCFAYVQGKSGGTDPGQGHTNTNVGQLTVQPPQGVSDSIYAAALCFSSMSYNLHTLLPYGRVGNPAVTPLNFPAVTGSLRLDLCGSCYTGSSYWWSGDGLVYYILVFPAF